MQATLNVITMRENIAEAPPKTPAKTESQKKKSKKKTKAQRFVST